MTLEERIEQQFTELDLAIIEINIARTELELRLAALEGAKND